MKTTLPTPEKIKSFTKEMIEALPTWDQHDKTELGGFAKRTWMKAPPSLVFIIKKEQHSVAYIFCNSYNGVIGKQFHTANIFLRDTIVGKMWIASSLNMYSDLEYYVTNPEIAI